ncbi:hypothetical protein DRQ32_05010 [bacterium]|nr:MAG: hypothetical protein DRQ32_05010 [bacterium]
MAGGDKRGPQGAGPMTGRGLGHCAGYEAPGYEADAAEARGRGIGRGHGRGRRARMGFGRGLGGIRGFSRGRGHQFGWDQDGYPDEAPRSASTDSLTELAADVTRLREQLAAMEKRLTNQTSAD